jgi:ubiquinone/menaquinone biosynthesis C-methylase UbiE
MKEMSRVLKPKGIACITTEYVIRNKKEPDYFTKDEVYNRLINPSGLKLIGDDIDFYIPSELIEKPFLFKNPLVPESEYPKIWPKIIFDVQGMLFTSVCFFLRK